VSGNDPHAGRERGVSLIELMVALVLGLIVTGSALTLVMTQRQTFSATEDLGQVQEGARLAFELLGRELRGAGGNPCDFRQRVNSGLKDPEANWWSDWADLQDGTALVPASAPGLRGYGGATAFPDSAFGTAVGTRVAGTDAIEIKAAVPVSADVAVLATELAAPGDPIKVNSTDGVLAGDLLVICNFNNVSIFKATAVDPDTIAHASGADAHDNESGELVRQNTDPAANFAAGTLVSKLHAARWYIGNNAAGGRSLYRAMLVNDAGAPGVSIDEIAQGITDMQLTYLLAGGLNYAGDEPAEDPINGVGVDFDNLDTLVTPVVGVRIVLTLSGDDRIGPNGEPLVRQITQTVAIRGVAQ
jgi:type IV pilus assembly protein PilW